MTRRDQTYDTACETLAEYFLGQPRSPEHVKALAQRVQQAVEDWFIDENGWFVPMSEPSEGLSANAEMCTHGEQT